MEGGPKVLKWQDNVVERAFLCGVTIEFTQLFGLEFERGRFFSPAEDRYNANKVVLGYTVAEALFGEIDPVGRELKLQGGKYEVVGVLKGSGDDLINPLDFDDAILVTYSKLRSLVNVNTDRRESFIAVKAQPNADLEQLKGEIKSLVRAERRLKPREDDTFAFNDLAMVSQSFDSFFGVLNLLGWVIGGFSILVGGVSVANIMFVSVKERTNLIGVKMALGAKKYIILLEFLIEAIILCLLGGLFGMVFITVAAKIITNALDFPIYLDLGNVFLGTSMSVLIGVVAGFIPALQASRLDPVDAMRQ
jgi:putative ABC transport system permease protein